MTFCGELKDGKYGFTSYPFECGEWGQGAQWKRRGSKQRAEDNNTKGTHLLYTSFGINYHTIVTELLKELKVRRDLLSV